MTEPELTPKQRRIEHEVQKLAAVLHAQRIGCKNEPTDPYDHGMPWEHTGDHEVVARAILQASRAVAPE